MAGVAVGAVIFFAGAVFGATGREAMIFGTFGSIAFIVGVGIAGAPGLNELQVVLSLLGGGALALLLSALHMLFSKPLPDKSPNRGRHCRPASGPG